MNYKSVTLYLVLLFFIFSSVFGLEIKQNDTKILTGIGNDKFSYGLSQNKDDQLTATTEFHFIFPDFFFNININSLTNRGTKSNVLDSSTFASGRYDELEFKAGTCINLFSTSNLELDFTPQAGFYILGNFGMEYAQNMNHKLSCVDPVNLEYEKFEKPFVPIINAKLCLSYSPVSFIQPELILISNNYIFYSTEQILKLNTVLGTKTLFSLSAGYKWNELHNNSSALKSYKDITQGFFFGFGLDTGLVNFDFVDYTDTTFGYGTIFVDFMNLKNHNWSRTDLNFYTGVCYLINTEFLETQIQSTPLNNFSFYFNSRYVSGFKTNKVNPSEYRYERDYKIFTAGIKYEQPLSFTQNWVTPYVELGTGIAEFGLQKIANHIPDSNFDFYKYETKTFWQLQANIGLDIIPQGALNFGNSTYSLTLYAGTIFIPDYVNASNQIKLDTYRTQNWQLKPFEFIYGITVHMGLDF